jgi:membrane-anchored protein YejM (alkaline phosphatase superfamily)
VGIPGGKRALEGSYLPMNASKVAQSENPWLSAARSVLPWVIPAAFSLYVKADMLKNKRAMHGGYVIAARSVGKVSLSYWEKVSFFRADLLGAFLLVPLGLLLVSRYLLPNRWRAQFIVLLSLAATIVLYLELSCFDAAGQFLSSHVMSAAISWGLLHDRSTIAKYLSLKPLVALAGLAAALIAGRWLANRRMRIYGNSMATRLWSIGAAVGLSGLVALTITAWASPIPATPYHRNVLGWILRSLADRTDVQTLEFVHLPDVELQDRYRAMASFTPAAQDARYWAKAKGCNVLFFVLETAPARVLPADGDLTDFPNLQRLRERSLVGASHYTTYAATHQAMFSIMSSWYPSAAIARVQNQQPDVVIPGLIATLSELGYDTAFYSPIDFKGEPDSEMYKSLGFQRQVYPPRESAQIDLGSSSTFNSNGSARLRLALDLAAVSLLKSDLERDLAEGRKFAYLFEPEVSHGPWADLKENGKERNVEKRGRNILQIPDQMLGDIMEVLQRHHQLENTVIVVVGDHGIRNPIEDPSLPSGTIDDYSFHVPLFIYVPKAIEHTVKIPYVTSHIDITPSIRSLLGIEQANNFEQGTPVWDPALAHRTAFFFGHDYLAADGYYSEGKFFMWSQMSDAVYQNTRMSFDGINPVPHNSSAYTEVTGAIRRMTSLNEVWAMHFSGTKQPLGFLAFNSK